MPKGIRVRYNQFGRDNRNSSDGMGKQLIQSRRGTVLSVAKKLPYLACAIAQVKWDDGEIEGCGTKFLEIDN